VSIPRQQLQERLQRAGAPAASPAAEEEAPLSRDALTLILLATAVSFVCSIDRAAMSVAILPMSEQFSWDDSTKGVIASAFFAGYMVRGSGFLCARMRVWAGWMG
jgi:hypothetical protein